MMMNPIGVFHCDAKYRYEAARQPEIAHQNRGRVVLHSGSNFEQALRDLEGFSRIWLIYEFHHNPHWKPMVKPPRAQRKMGVFATRAPYRPNPIGLSCVELVSVRGLQVEVGPHDLLDGTPILDLKPYVPYADSFPDARCGWLEEVEVAPWRVAFSERALKELAWIEGRAENSLRAFLLQQLSELPLDGSRKRVRPVEGERWEIAYRTWRADFVADAHLREIVVEGIRSGYMGTELDAGEDPYGDKELHRVFGAWATEMANGLESRGE